jgi:2'-5' RNA ligase
MLEAPAAPTRRLFFAMWPAADVANKLGAAAHSAHIVGGGRRMQGESLHLTLAFLGDLPADRFAIAEAAAAELSGKPFLLRLDRLGYWRHNRILWAGCAVLPAPMLELVADLSTVLRAASFALESRPFAAHITLLRDARWQTLPTMNEQIMSEPIDWPVADFALVESNLSGAGPRYQVRHRWPLRSA